MMSGALRALLATNRRSSTSADVSERSSNPYPALWIGPMSALRQKQPFDGRFLIF
jgi:hypothetical protein